MIFSAFNKHLYIFSDNKLPSPWGSCSFVSLKNHCSLLLISTKLHDKSCLIDNSKPKSGARQLLFIFLPQLLVFSQSDWAN